jgi:hypothetical protein
MKTFSVYQHPMLGSTAVKHGFSWPAFVFGIFWAMRHKLWHVVGGICLGYGVIAVLGLLGEVFAFTETRVVAALSYGYLWLFLAFQGNACLRQHLEQQGYVVRKTLHVASATEAIALTRAAVE